MYHNVTILGNLGSDPDLRYTPNGNAVCSLNVACNHKYSNANGELIEETTWFRVSTWGKSAEAVSQYLHKGNPVFIEGRMKPDENGNPKTFSRNDGSVGASYEVTASLVKFINGAKAGQTMTAEDASPVPAKQKAPVQAAEVDEIIV